MQNIIVLFAFILVAGIMQAQAQNTPGVDQRQKNQRQRIQGGVVSGELTRVEATNARQNQHHIRRTERRAESDGVVTSMEKAKLVRKQNKASCQLRKDKHDARDRPRAN
jgi:hypothetical protein